MLSASCPAVPQAVQTRTTAEEAKTGMYYYRNHVARLPNTAGPIAVLGQNNTNARQRERENLPFCLLGLNRTVSPAGTDPRRQAKLTLWGPSGIQHVPLAIRKKTPLPCLALPCLPMVAILGHPF